MVKRNLVGPFLGSALVLGLGGIVEVSGLPTAYAQIPSAAHTVAFWNLTPEQER